MVVNVPEVCDCCGMAKYHLHYRDAQWLCRYCAELLRYGDVYVAEQSIVPYVYT